MYSDTEDEWVCYHPPKSVHFGHQSRVRDARQAWAMTSKFLADFAIPKLERTIELQCIVEPALVSEQIATHCVGAARTLFGTERDSNGHSSCWTLTEEQLPPAVALALDVDRWPPQQIPAVSLQIPYSFAWRDLTDRSPPVGLTGYDEDWMFNASFLNVLIGLNTGTSQVFLQPKFRIPFPLDSPKFTDFMTRINEACPFRFRKGYFKSERRIKGRLEA